MQNNIYEIIKSEDLKSITIDLVEKVLDNEITNEVIKEIPILKTLAATWNIYNTYTDRIFIKKTMSVLLEIGETNWKERVELTKELDDNNSSGTEKILMAIDNMQSIEKCKIFGRLCKLKALKKIELQDFLRLTKLIEDSFIPDLKILKDFVSKEKKSKTLSDYEISPILSLGLVVQLISEPSPIEMSPAVKYGESDSYSGGEFEVYYDISNLGEILMKYYDDLFQVD